LSSQSSSSQQLYFESPKDFLVFKYYLEDAKLFVKHNPSGGFYDWPFIPPSVEKELNTAKTGDYYIIRKGKEYKESDWQALQNIDDFIVLVKK
jgi:hypothetical protein